MALWFTILLLPQAKEEPFPKEVREKALAATVRLVNVDQGSEGTGVIIKHDRGEVYILTANHVVANVKNLELYVRGTEGKPVVYRSARVLGGSTLSDLAIVRLRSTDKFPEALPICPKGKGPRARAFNALSVGWPKNGATAQVERVRQKLLLKRPGETESIWSYETERKPTPGRSGGPLVDTSGQILGVASGHDEKSGYFTHFDEIHRFLRENGLQWLIDTV